jgi:glycosyltransferase involved in cell wall biosynthesis
MRIAHVTISHRPFDVRIFWKECRTLADAGHDVHVFIPGEAPEPKDGIIFHPLPDIAPTAYFWRVWRHLRAIHRAARAVEADVYHLPDPTLIPIALLLRRRGAKVVYDAHEDRPLQARTKYYARPVVGRVSSRLFAGLERVAKRRFDAFVAATPAIARAFPAERTALVRNFPLLEEFPEWRLRRARPHRERPNTVAYVGGIQLHMGLREMVKALELVPRRLNVRLVLMGDFSRSHPSFVDEVHRLPGWSRVEHLGWVSREAVVERLLDARIGLSVFHPRPELPEALPTKLFEYMAAGVPVLASDFPLWSALIGEARCGLTVDPLDPQAIADGIVTLLDDPDAAEAMGARGRRAVETTYNWSTERARLLELYASLAPATPASIGTCPGSDPTRASQARIAAYPSSE